jgi:hypothetical protein
MNIQEISVENLVISPFNVRQLPSNDDEIKNLSLERLENDIKINGLLNPLTVYYNDKTNTYEILAGCRRFYVLNRLKYSHIKCNILTNIKTDTDKIILSFSENIQRKDMKLSQKIRTIKNLERLYKEQYPLEKRTDIKINKEIKQNIVEKTNYNQRSIGQYLKISHLPDFILDKLDKKGEEKISLDFAVCLDKLNNFNEKELIKIIDLFHDVKNFDRLKIIKKILNECKYDKNIDFTLYINNIGKIKTKYFDDLNKENQEKLRNEQLLFEILNTNSHTNNSHTNNTNSHTNNNNSNNNSHTNNSNTNNSNNNSHTNNTNSNNNSNSHTNNSNTKIKKVLTLDEYDEKIKNIIKNNDNNVFVKGTKIRIPELQNLFRKQIVYRYNRCIISNMYKSVCEAAHITPFSETLSFDVDNGILLNDILHKLFDKYYWSINPQSLCVELFIDNTNGAYDILKPYENKYIECLKNYPKSIESIVSHYNKAKNN